MDIIENALDAEASLIFLSIAEDGKEKVLRISIKDNGRGIPESIFEQITDPFVTTRTTRRVGLGLSLFKESAKRCDGEFDIRSKQGEGTEVRASFRTDHIDTPPLGDIAGALTSLIMTHPEVDFVYTHETDGNQFEMDTRQIKKELDSVPIYHPEVITHVAQTIRKSLKGLKA
jgi:DNA mismatch repair ATPase MutL